MQRDMCYRTIEPRYNTEPMTLISILSASCLTRFRYNTKQMNRVIEGLAVCLDFKKSHSCTNYCSYCLTYTSKRPFPRYPKNVFRLVSPKEVSPIRQIHTVFFPGPFGSADAV